MARPAPADRNKTSAQLKREKIVRDARPASGVLDKRRFSREDVERIRDVGSRPAPVFRVGQTAYKRPSVLGPLDNRPAGPLTGSDALAARYRIWMRSPKSIDLANGQRLDVGGGGVGFFSPSLRSPDPKVRRAAQERLIASYRTAITPALEQYERGRSRAFQENIPGIAQSFSELNKFNRQQDEAQALLDEQAKIAAQYDPLEVRRLYTEPIAPWSETVSPFQAERIYGLQPGSSIYGYRGGGEGDKFSIPLQPGENPSLGLGKREGRNDEEQWMERPQLRRLDRGKIVAQLYASGLKDAGRRAGIDIDIPLVTDKGLPSGVSRQQMMAEVYQDAYDAYLRSVEGWRDLIANDESRDFVKTYARKTGINLDKGPSLDFYGKLATPDQPLPDGTANVASVYENVPLSDLRVVRRTTEDGKNYAFIRSPTSDVITKVEVHKSRGGKDVVKSQRWEDTFTSADLRNVGMSIASYLVYEGPIRLPLTSGADIRPFVDQTIAQGPKLQGFTQDIGGWIANNSKPIAGKPRNIYAGGYRKAEDGGDVDAISDWIDDSLGSVTEKAWDQYVKQVNNYLKKSELRGAAAATGMSFPLEAGAYAVNFVDKIANGDDASAALYDSFRLSMGKPVIVPTSKLPVEYREYVFGRDKEGMQVAIAGMIEESNSEKPTALTKVLRNALEAQAIAATSAKLTASEASGLTDTQLLDIAYSGNTEVEQILQNAGRNISEIPALPAGILAVGEQLGAVASGTREEQTKAVQTVLDPILQYWQAWGNAALWTASAGQLGEVESLKREAYNNPLWTGLSAVQGAGVAARMATIVGRTQLVSKMGRVGAAYNDLANTERVIARFPMNDPLVAAAADNRPRTGPNGSVAVADLTEDELAAYKSDVARWRKIPEETRNNTPAPRAEDYFNTPAQVARILGESGVSLGYARPNIVSQFRKRIQKNLFESKSSIGQRYRDFVLSNRGKDIVNDAQRVARALADDRLKPLITELQKLPRFDRARAVFDLLVATDVAIPERFGVDIGVDGITPQVIADRLRENLDEGVIVLWDSDAGALVTRKITTPDKAQMKANIAFLENLEKASSMRGTELFNEIRQRARLVEGDNILMIQAMGVGGDISRRLEDISMLGMRDATRAFGDTARARVLAEKEQLGEVIDYNEALLESGAFSDDVLRQGPREYRSRVENKEDVGEDAVVAAANDVLADDLAGLASGLVRGETTRSGGQAAFDDVEMEIPALMLPASQRKPEEGKRPKLPSQDLAERILRQNILFALAGIEQEAWYRHAGDWLRSSNLSPEDNEMFAAIMAITSPQRSVFDNIKDASAVWQRMQKARSENIDILEALSDLTWLNAEVSKKIKFVYDNGVDAWLSQNMRGRGTTTGASYKKSDKSDVKTAQFYYAIMKEYDPQRGREIADKYNITVSGSTPDVHDVRSKITEELPKNAKGKSVAVGSVEDRNQAEFNHEVNRLTLTYLREYAKRSGNVRLQRIVDETDEDGIQAAVWNGARTASKENGWEPGMPVTSDIVSASYRSNNAPPSSAVAVGSFEEGSDVGRLALNLGVEAAPGADSTVAYRAFWDSLEDDQKRALSERAFVELAKALALVGVRADIGSTGAGVWAGNAAYSGSVRAFGQAFRSAEKLSGAGKAAGTPEEKVALLRALSERGFAPEDIDQFIGNVSTDTVLDVIRFLIDADMDPDVLGSVLPILSAFGKSFDQDSVAYSRVLDSELLRTKNLTKLANGIVFKLEDGSRIQPGMVDDVTRRIEEALSAAGIDEVFVVYNHIDESRGMFSIVAGDPRNIQRQDVRDIFVDLDPASAESVEAFIRLRGKGESPLSVIINDALDETGLVADARGGVHVRSNLIDREEYDARIREGKPRVDEGSRGTGDVAGAGNSATEAVGIFDGIRAAFLGEYEIGVGPEPIPRIARQRISGGTGEIWFQADNDAGLNVRGALGRDARNLSSGQYILFLFRNQADASTLVHELVGHVIARDLYAVAPTDLKNLEDFIGKSYRDWTRDDHERIARIAEEYFRTGRVPVEGRRGRQASNVKLGRAMQKIKTIIGGIYHSVAYTAPGQPRATTRTSAGPRLETDVITPEVRAVFDKYFGVPPNRKLAPIKSKVRADIRNAAIVAGIDIDDVEAVMTVLDARAYAWGKLTGRKPADWYSDPRGAGISRAVVRTRIEEIDAGGVMRTLYEAKQRDKILDDRLVFIQNAAEERMRRILRESPESAALFAPTFGRFPSGTDPAMPSGGVQTGRGKLGRRARRRSMEAIELGKFLLPARDTLDEAAYISGVLRNARVPTEVYEYLVAVMRAFKQDGIILNNPEAIRWAKGEVDSNEWAVIQVDSFAGGKRIDNVRSEDIRRIIGADADLSDERKFAKVAREIVKDYGLEDLDENATYILIPKTLYNGANRQTEFLSRGISNIARLTRGWQRLALTTLPRTPIANIVGSGVLAATRGFSPQALRTAIAIARGTDPNTWPPEIRNMGLYGALLGPADAIQNSTVRGLYSPISWWMEQMHKGNVMGEDFSRLVVYVQTIMEEANKVEGKRVLASLRSMNDDAQLLFDYVLAGGDSAQANIIRERALRSVEDWIGRYQRGGKFEQMLSTLVPFNQWYRHILRLYYLTMPFNYPGRSAVMGGLSQMGADYLAEHGVYPEWYMDIIPTEENEREVVDYLSTGETGVIGKEREVSGIRTQALNPYATAAMIAEPRSTLLRSLNPFLTLLVSAITGQVAKPGAKFGFGPAIAGQDINGSPVYLDWGPNTDTLKFILKLVEDRAVPLGILKEGGKFDTSSMAIEAIREAAGLSTDTKLYEGPSGASSEKSIAPSRAELTPETVFLRFIGLSPVVTDAGGIASLGRTIKQMQRQSKPPREAVVSG